MMLKKTLALSTLVTAFLLSASPAPAEDQQQDQAQKQTRKQIYGSQMMTPEERAEYRAKMKSLKTREEREAFRMEHHEKMKERAKEKGLTLPDEPPARGGGMGPRGGGMGSGGGGMGPRGR